MTRARFSSSFARPASSRSVQTWSCIGSTVMVTVTPCSEGSRSTSVWNSYGSRARLASTERRRSGPGIAEPRSRSFQKFRLGHLDVDAGLAGVTAGVVLVAVVDHELDPV